MNLRKGDVFYWNDSKYVVETAGEVILLARGRFGINLHINTIKTMVRDKLLIPSKETRFRLLMDKYERNKAK